MSPRSRTSVDEAALVRLVRRRFAGLLPEGALSLEDDAAVLPPVRKGHARVVSVDQAHEGIHFLARHADSAGWRAMVRNLSDLAAMGATPVGCVWTLALSPAWLDDDARLLDAFLRGAARACRRYGLPMYGGDLSRSRAGLSSTVTVFGNVRGTPLTRSGARVGDGVYVSRPLGAAAAGLALLNRASSPKLSRLERQALRAHLWPEPELALGRLLVGKASACMDVSDGLALDAARLARASGVALHLDTDALRDAVHPAAGDVSSVTSALGFERALGGGDDYALLFTLPEGMRAPRGSLRIGAVRRGRGVFLVERTPGGREQKRPLDARGYEHFSRAPA